MEAIATDPFLNFPLLVPILAGACLFFTKLCVCVCVRVLLHVNIGNDFKVTVTKETKTILQEGGSGKQTKERIK